MASASDYGSLPVPPIDRWLAPVQRFLHIEAASGMVLMACTVVALTLANSPLAASFAAIWKTPVAMSFGTFALTDTLGHLVINDGLMTIFFFVVGLEIKREIVDGELRDPRKALLPVFAAAGGMIFPALVYLVFQYGEPGQRGWAIPMATDIAFVVGVLALLGRRIPFSLKILLLSLAIVDDLGAVLIIALVYTESVSGAWLGLAAVGFGVTYTLNRVGVRRVNVYVMVGAVIWLAFLKSGVHPTVAGVLLGLLTPSSAWVGNKAFGEVLDETWKAMRGKAAKSDGGDSHHHLAELERLIFAARETISPLHRLETALHPWVGFAIMPVFALANAGVPLEPAGLGEPVAVAVAAGLAIGKPLGILLMCWVAITLGLAGLPAGVTWRMLAGGACLAGIGFTMALFLNTLAFPVADFPTKEAAGKIGTLAGSLVSAVVGVALLLSVAAPTALPAAEGGSADVSPNGSDSADDTADADNTPAVVSAVVNPLSKPGGGKPARGTKRGRGKRR